MRPGQEELGLIRIQETIDRLVARKNVFAGVAKEIVFPGGYTVGKEKRLIADYKANMELGHPHPFEFMLERVRDAFPDYTGHIELVKYIVAWANKHKHDELDERNKEMCLKLKVGDTVLTPAANGYEVNIVTKVNPPTVVDGIEHRPWKGHKDKAYTLGREEFPRFANDLIKVV